jgi:CDP-diacylglycerol--glycerol-3-phosphate 3-phosphatidyltransferase
LSVPKIWTVSNVISLSRTLLVVPAGYSLLTEFPHHRLWSAGFILLAAATDFIDGYLARRLHEVTDTGKIIDPLADKIVVGIFSVCLLMTGDLPLWFVAAVLGRDILIFLGGVYVRRQKGIVPQSNMTGKVAVNIIALAILLSTLNIESLALLRLILIWLSVLFMVLSMVIYSKRLFIGMRVGTKV